MTTVDLTKGDFARIFTDSARYNNPTQGVYQVYNVRKTEGANANRKNLIMISDGQYHMKALLRNQAAAKFQTLELQRGDVIRVLVAEPAIVRERKKYVLLVDDFELVQSGIPLVNQASTFLDSYFAEHPNEGIQDDVDSKTHNSGSANVPTASSNSISTGSDMNAQHQAMQDRKSDISSSQKSRPIFAIEQLSPYQNVWTIKARLSYKGDIKTWHNQRGDGKLLNVNFLDTSGEIRATAFNDMATKFNELLQEGKVYYISKARLQPAKPQFTNLSHPYELSMDRETVIEESFDESDVPKTHYNFVKLDAVPHQEANSSIDVIGVIKTVNPHFELVSKAGKKFDRRDITIVDDTDVAIEVGLWNQQAVDFNLPEGSVVAIKGVRVSDFGGKSLSMGFSSTLAANPELDEAYALKGWYDSVGKNAKFSSVSKEAGASSISSGNMAKFISQRIPISKALNDNLGANEKGDFFSIKAAVSFLKVDNFAYPACTNEGCNKKVFEQPDGTWRCEKCDTNNSAPKYRYVLTTAVMDESGQLWLTLFDDQAKVLFGEDANTLMSYKENDPDEFSRVTQSIQMNQYDFRVRAREDNYNDQTRIRYTVANLHTLNFKAEADYLAEELTKALVV